MKIQVAKINDNIILTHSNPQNAPKFEKLVETLGTRYYNLFRNVVPIEVPTNRVDEKGAPLFAKIDPFGYAGNFAKGMFLYFPEGKAEEAYDFITKFLAQDIYGYGVIVEEVK